MKDWPAALVLSVRTKRESFLSRLALEQEKGVPGQAEHQCGETHFYQGPDQSHALVIGQGTRSTLGSPVTKRNVQTVTLECIPRTWPFVPSLAFCLYQALK